MAKKYIKQFTKGHTPIPILIDGVDNIKVYFKKGVLIIKKNGKA